MAPPADLHRLPGRVPLDLFFGFWVPLARAVPVWMTLGALGALLIAMLAVPFVLIEPLKVFALYWIAVGHIVQGTILLVFSHALSILTLERLYRTGEGQLAKIGWFARLMRWLVGLRDWAFGWVKQTAAWQSAARLASEIRGWFRNLVRSVR